MCQLRRKKRCVGKDRFVKDKLSSARVQTLVLLSFGGWLCLTDSTVLRDTSHHLQSYIDVNVSKEKAGNTNKYSVQPELVKSQNIYLS